MKKKDAVVIGLVLTGDVLLFPIAIRYAWLSVWIALTAALIIIASFWPKLTMQFARKREVAGLGSVSEGTTGIIAVEPVAMVEEPDFRFVGAEVETAEKVKTIPFAVFEAAEVDVEEEIDAVTEAVEAEIAEEDEAILEAAAVDAEEETDAAPEAVDAEIAEEVEAILEATEVDVEGEIDAVAEVVEAEIEEEVETILEAAEVDVEEKVEEVVTIPEVAEAEAEFQKIAGREGEPAGIEAAAAVESQPVAVEDGALILAEKIEKAINSGFAAKYRGDYAGAAAHFSHALTLRPQADMAFSIIVDLYGLWKQEGREDYAREWVDYFRYNYEAGLDPRLQDLYLRWVSEKPL